MADWVIGLDKQWRVTFLNTAAARALASDGDALIGEAIWDLVPEALGTPLEHMLRAAMAEQTPRQLEHQCDESAQWIDIRAHPTEHELIVLVADVTARKQAELASRVSEQWFHQVVDGMAVAIYLTDAEGRLLRCNQRAIELWGRAPELGSSGERFCGSVRLYRSDGTPLSHAECPLAEVLRTGEPIRDREVLIERPDGSRLTVLANPSPVRDDAGRLLGAINCLVDITARRAAEAVAERFATRRDAIAQFGQMALTGGAMRALMDEAVHLVARMLEVELCSVLEYEPDGRRLSLRAGVGWRPGCVGAVTVEAGSASQAGYTLMRGEPVIVKDMRMETRFRESALLREHEVVSGLSVPIPSLNGRPWGVLEAHNTRPRTFDEDDVSFLQGVAHILAEAIQRERHEAALRESERRARARAEELAAVMEAVPAMVFVACDPEGRRLVGSHETYTFLGMPQGTNLAPEPDAAPDRRPRFTVYENGQPLAPDALPWQRAVRGEHVYNWEGRIAFADGGSRAVLGNGAPLYADDGTVRGAVVALLDVTERKQAEAELKQWAQTLEQRVAERTAELEHRLAELRVLATELTEAEQRERQRLAQVLHDDLQQLLVGAKMQAGTLRTLGRAGFNEGAVRGLETLLEQAIRSSRSLSSELAPTVLYELGLASALHWLARWAHEKYELTVHVEADESIQLDNEHMRLLLFQAVRELLLNVVKHAGVSEAWITMGWHEQQLYLSVEDRGRGFDWSAEQQQREGCNGRGLLSFQQRLELLGVTVTIDSAPWCGTRVTFSAPATRQLSEVAASDEPAAHEGAASGAAVCVAFRDQPIRVVLTDDHKILREGLANVLSQQPGIELVGQAASGQEAIELANDLQPDVMVMDISLPDISGIEVTRRVKRAMPGLRVIGLSIHDKQDVASAMYGAGATAYLSKAGSFDQLLETIRKAGAAAPGDSDDVGAPPGRGAR